MANLKAVVETSEKRLLPDAERQEDSRNKNTEHQLEDRAGREKDHHAGEQHLPEHLESLPVVAVEPVIGDQWIKLLALGRFCYRQTVTVCIQHIGD